MAWLVRNRHHYRRSIVAERKKKMSDFNIPIDLKHQMLEERILQLNAEGYRHELNLKQFEAVGAGDSPEAEQTRQAIETIKAALTVCAEELEATP